MSIHFTTLKLYDFESGIIEQQYPATSIAFAPDNATFALGFPDGRIELRTVKDDQLLQTFSAHTDKITTLTFLSEGDRLLSAGIDCKLNVWQISDSIPFIQLDNHLECCEFGFDNSNQVCVMQI